MQWTQEKYATHVAEKVGCSYNYPQPPPLVGRPLLQFNAAQQNEF